MRITAIQLPARYGAVAAQLALVEALLLAGEPTELVLLPEASLTGYLSPSGDFDLTPFGEPIGGPTRAALGGLAARFDCLMVGPIIERAGDACFNAMIGVAPTGEVTLHYRKRHPWYPESWATAGTTSGRLASWRGLTLTTAICFDAHFLEEDAAEALDAADLLLFPSAWVDTTDSLPALLSSLARAHHLAVLNANWGPGDPRIEGQGGSLFVDQRGVTGSRLSAPIGRLDVTLEPRSSRAARCR